MKKKKNRLFKVLFWIFFISFMIIYFSELTGYYEYKNYQKTIMTNEQIKQYEMDIRNGKKVNPDNYLLSDTTKYDNKLSDVADNLSNEISKIVKGGVNNTFKLIANLTSN